MTKPFDPTEPYCRRDGVLAKIVYTFSNNGDYLVVWEQNGKVYILAENSLKTTAQNRQKEYAYRVHRNGLYTFIDMSESIADLINIPDQFKALPQPDLTKLKEAYTTMSKLDIYFTVNRFNGMDDMLEFAEHFGKLWQALKEVLKCKD